MRMPSTLTSHWARSPKSTARASPAKVPNMAQADFFVTPAIKIKLTTATYTQTKNVVIRVGNPFINKGIKTKIRHSTVKARPSRDCSPFFRPMITVIATKPARISII